jgi:peptidoglycan/LPS O-acetylase OafA/YrhL
MAATKSRLEALTGLRFFAAFAIVILHSRGRFLPNDALAGWPLGAGVSFFFVLSGFILTHVYPELPTLDHARKFLLARFARIWPVHLLWLILSMLLIPELILKGALPFLANIFAVHAWIPRGDYFFSFNAVSWSISVEFGLYLMFPLLIASVRSNRARLVMSLTAAAALIALCVFLDPPPFDMEHTGLSSTGLLAMNPFARLFEFVLGMSAALLWKTRQLGTGRRSAIAWTIAEAFTIAALTIYIANLRQPIFGLVSQSLPKPLLIWLTQVDIAPLFAALILVMATGAGWLSRFLGNVCLIFLGEISYSIYMLHNVTIAFLAQHGLFFEMPQPFRFAFVVAIIISLSTVSYLFIERPTRRLITETGGRFIQRQRLAPALS